MEELILKIVQFISMQLTKKEVKKNCHESLSCEGKPDTVNKGQTWTLNMIYLIQISVVGFLAIPSSVVKFLQRRIKIVTSADDIGGELHWHILTF